MPTKPAKCLPYIGVESNVFWENHLGKLCRSNSGPGYYNDSTIEWFSNKEDTYGLHREGGPAQILDDGRRFWYINSFLVTWPGE